MLEDVMLGNVARDIPWMSKAVAISARLGAATVVTSRSIDARGVKWASVSQLTTELVTLVLTSIVAAAKLVAATPVLQAGA